MEYSEDVSKLKQWMPLIMEGRDNQAVAATKVDYGTDVDFGALTRGLISHLQKQNHFELQLNQNVRRLKQDKRGIWHVNIQDRTSKKSHTVNAKFVFLGAGGGALPLLQKSRIPESKGYGGFPVSGLWLVCKNPEIIKQHNAKVYGKAAIGAPPMSVPHLDTRIIDGKRSLLFGPYAGFSTKFLKNGSWLDLFKSIRLGNLMPLAAVGVSSLDLVKYLIGQVLQTKKGKFDTLREYYPGVNPQNWYVEVAGQRVQIIKKDKLKTGVLEFGTEIVESSDSSMVALLGASPGASTAASIMINVVDRMSPTGLLPDDWKARMKAIIPSYGDSLITNEALCNQIRAETAEVLGLHNII
jgi:malate dehydrogenase (quinone)